MMPSARALSSSRCKMSPLSHDEKESLTLPLRGASVGRLRGSLGHSL